VGLFSDSKRKRSICAAVIGFSMDIGVVPELLRLLKDESSAVRFNALLSLSKIAYKRIPLDLLIPSLEDEDASVRRNAVICIQKTSTVLTEKRVVKELSRLFDDPDFGVRMNVALALGKIGSIEGLLPLCERGIKDKDDRVRYNSAIALAELKSYDSIECLVKAGESEFNEAVKREIARALKIITSENYGKDFEKWRLWWGDFKAQRKSK
jgi:HEAT repeat protein